MLYLTNFMFSITDLHFESSIVEELQITYSFVVLRLAFTLVLLFSTLQIVGVVQIQYLWGTVSEKNGHPGYEILERKRKESKKV